MKASSAAVQGGLAAVALLAAYFTWQKEPEKVPGDVVVLDARPSEVSLVRYDDGTRWAEVLRDGAGSWVKYGARPAPPKPPGPAADGGTASPDGGTAQQKVRPPDPFVMAPVERQLRGNDLAGKLLERFAPLYGSRALGTLPKEKVAELGLADTPRRLEVTVKGARRTFKVSAASVSVSAPYLLDEADGHVYLVPQTVVADLDAASARLVERRFHEFRQDEVDGFSVRAGDKERVFTQSGSFSAGFKVAAKASPDKPDELAKAWIDRVWRFIPTEILGKGEDPADGQPQVEARVEFLRSGNALGWLELARLGANGLWIRTEHTAGWVKVHLGATDVLPDAKKLAGQ